MKKTVYFICNAHIDPVWLWKLEEGLSVALSTFRVACDLLEEYDFIFCHNEAILYQFIEKNDPILFGRIKKHIQNGKWKVMGGWYLQPDCNMPCGESFIRQIQVGKQYFQEKFGVDVRTAISFDAFGHSAGLPQILKKTGYDSYIITRPADYQTKQIKENEFIWEGVDGSKIKTCKVELAYGTQAIGAIKEKFEQFIKQNYKHDMLFLWGVGNHGGGPSREDLNYIQSVQQDEWEIKHSYPEEYFDRQKFDFEYKGGINPTMPGCYSSMVRIKQKHRELENALYKTEKMMSAASIVADAGYDQKALDVAVKDLLLSEFHDILPGSTIKQGEEQALNHLARGIITCSELQNEAFVALAQAQPTAKDGEYPIMVYNPYPYEIEQRIECEIILKSQNHELDFTVFDVYNEDGEPIESQLVKEDSSLNLDWVKRITFNAKLKPFKMNRFSAYEKRIFRRPVLPAMRLPYEFDNGIIRVRIGESGLIESLVKDGKEFLNGQACKLAVYSDTEDPWAMRDETWGEVSEQFNTLGNKIGEFALVKAGELRNIMMYSKFQAPVRIVESGEILERVESVFSYEKSYARVLYTFNRKSADIRIDIQLYNMERQVCVKMEIPTTVYGRHIGEIAFGTEELNNHGQECVSQKWHMLEDGKYAIGFINDGLYASMAEDGLLAQTLLRSPVYASHPLVQKKPVFDEYCKGNIDLGEREFSFKLVCGTQQETENTIDLKAQLFNEKLTALNYFPRKSRELTEEFVLLDNKNILMTTFKKNEHGTGYIIRLFNNHNRSECANLKVADQSLSLEFTEYEVKTILVDSILKEAEQMLI